MTDITLLEWLQGAIVSIFGLVLLWVGLKMVEHFFCD
jgi:hypothetical protein